MMSWRRLKTNEPALVPEQRRVLQTRRTRLHNIIGCVRLTEYLIEPVEHGRDIWTFTFYSDGDEDGRQAFTYRDMSSTDSPTQTNYDTFTTADGIKHTFTDKEQNTCEAKRVPYGYIDYDTAALLLNKA